MSYCNYCRNDPCSLTPTPTPTQDTGPSRTLNLSTSDGEFRHLLGDGSMVLDQVEDLKPLSMDLCTSRSETMSQINCSGPTYTLTGLGISTKSAVSRRSSRFALSSK